jgi:hypothetical protein
MGMVMSMITVMAVVMAVARAVGMNMFVPVVGIVTVYFHFARSAAACRTHMPSPVA